VPLIASQYVRLAMVEPPAWLAADYAGRLGALALLYLLPRARSAAFARTPRRTGWLETLAWIIALVLFDRVLHGTIRPAVDAALPNTKLGLYPDVRGIWWLIDMTFGLYLVAYSEEIIFRRAVRAVLQPSLGDGWAMIVVSALLFAAYHWWTGLANIAATFLFGLAAMLALRRVAAIWPVVTAHYLIDVISFA
jgi:uncharacterized protein